MLDTNDLLQEYKKAVAELYGDRLYRVILYGSRARSDFHEESDFDWMVVLKDAEIDNFTESRKVRHMTIDIGLKHN